MTFQKTSPMVELINDSQAIKETLNSLLVMDLVRCSVVDNDCNNGTTIIDLTTSLVVR